MDEIIIADFASLFTVFPFVLWVKCKSKKYIYLYGTAHICSLKVLCSPFEGIKKAKFLVLCLLFGTSCPQRGNVHR